MMFPMFRMFRLLEETESQRPQMIVLAVATSAANGASRQLWRDRSTHALAGSTSNLRWPRRGHPMPQGVVTYLGLTR